MNDTRKLKVDAYHTSSGKEPFIERAKEYSLDAKQRYEEYNDGTI